MIKRDSFLIGTRWASSKGSGLRSVVSPATEEVIGTVPESVNADVDAAVSAARDAFESGPWPRMDFKERAGYMLRIGQILTPRIEEAVRLQIDEMGGPRAFVSLVTGGTVSEIPYVIEAARRVETREVREGSTGKVVVMRDPIGVVAGVIPWNVPIASVLGKMLPALLSGCPIIVKPALETPLSAYLVAEAAIEAGLPAGVLSIVPGDREVGEYLVTHPGVESRLVHRQQRRRHASRSIVRRAPKECQPRAGWEVSGHYLEGRHCGSTPEHAH